MLFLKVILTLKASFSYTKPHNWHDYINPSFWSITVTWPRFSLQPSKYKHTTALLHIFQVLAILQVSLLKQPSNRFSYHLLQYHFNRNFLNISHSKVFQNTSEVGILIFLKLLSKVVKQQTLRPQTWVLLNTKGQTRSRPSQSFYIT